MIYLCACDSGLGQEESGKRTVHHLDQVRPGRRAMAGAWCDTSWHEGRGHRRGEGGLQSALSGLFLAIQREEKGRGVVDSVHESAQ